jgi:hypothetical protein
MRVLLVEVPDVAIEGRHRLVETPRVRDLEPTPPGAAARGGLAERQVRPQDHDPSQGEPW